nr:DNA cytosine methyltransferase [Lactobacillus johnsonii]
MFAGIGGFRSGLEKAGHQCVGYIEWDKYARKSYQAIYNTEGEYTAHDIKEVKGIELPDADLWTFGSPCQDISIAGKQKGIVEGGRSSMFFEVIRCLKERIGGEKTLPSILIMENVKALLSSNGGWDFARVIIEMDQVGYDVEWAVLNSSDVVPQNRERVYIIGHLRGTSTRQVFPIQRQGTDLVRTSPKIGVVGNTSSTDYKSQNVISSNGISPTLTATDYKHPKQVAVRQVGNIVKHKGFSNPQRGRIYSANGLSPTLNTVQGGGLEPKVLIERPLKGLTKNGWHFEQNVFSKNSIAATLKAGGGSGNIPKIAYRPCLTPDRINKRQNGRRFKNCEDPAFTLTSQDRHGVLIESDRALAIRKLTPKECWRLQGFSDDQFEKAKQAGVSNSQLYKQAGNAVTVDVVEQIGKRLVIE